MPEDKIELTSSTNSPASSSTTSKSHTGPGSRLRTAREARNMAVTEVATQLRLDSNVISAIENDDFAALPSATFVKGYLRSYGGILALDVDVLIAEYQAAKGAEETVIRVPVKPASDGSTFGKWFWLILALVSVLLLAWYWSKPNDQPVSTDSLRSDSSLMPSTDVEYGVENLSPNDSQIETPSNTTDPVIEQLLLGLQDPVKSTPTIPEESGAVETATKTNIELAKANPVAEAVAAADLATLSLIGVTDSWVSIRDARDNRVFRDMLKPGQRREVSGVAPLIVHLGYAPGVKVEANGQAFDHSQWHKSNSTARFVFPKP